MVGRVLKPAWPRRMPWAEVLDMAIKEVCRRWGWPASLCVLVILGGCGVESGSEAAGEHAVARASAGSAIWEQDHVTAPSLPKAGNTRSALAPEATSVAPQELAGLIAQDDQVVAQANEDLDGDGAVDAVLIVRHQSTESRANPCELLVLQRQAGRLAVSARSGHVVECLYNTVARNAASLQDNLKVARGEIIYTNQREKGTSIYQFNYDQAKQAWFLSEAINSYPQCNEAADKVDLVREAVSYPKDVGWTTLDLFDPDALEEAFAKNRKIRE